MIRCSGISTCVKKVIHLSGRFQHMGSTFLSVVSGGRSPSCCFSLYSCKPMSSYTRLSVSKTLSAPSGFGFQTLRRNSLVPGLCQQRSSFKSLTVKGLISARSHLKRHVNVSLPCQNMNVRFSASKRGVVSKIETKAGSTLWSQGFASAGLIFGLSVCCSSPEPSYTEAFSKKKDEEQDDCNRSQIKSSHGKKVYTDYSIIGIPGDGRCMFRSVAHGACLRAGKLAPSESLQRELADDLRAKVADEFIKRREETEWFIEGDFETYVAQMRKPHVWGGEPELLMASHVLKMPITVYMYDNDAGGLISIAEYGQEYGKDDPIRIIYHGFGHYDALQFPGRGRKSKL
ncbi:hypothetical protein Tsubulata_031625 [Turnera subulata]|uniref:Ubiquitin thioesterase OTU n=1 Tax=Turnera subulata TaxID=218843 RepID=A0A9Q0J5V1_9ROSI|nr:hypothetical protein Tsubulata_031625 [Turnera subulata]